MRMVEPSLRHESQAAMLSKGLMWQLGVARGCWLVSSGRAVEYLAFAVTMSELESRLDRQGGALAGVRASEMARDGQSLTDKLRKNTQETFLFRSQALGGHSEVTAQSWQELHPT